jgi:hypothetical protein
MDDEMQKGVLGEVLMDELKAIREYVQEIPNIKKTVESIDGRLSFVETDVKVIKAVVREHDSEIRELKQKVA